MYSGGFNYSLFGCEDTHFFSHGGNIYDKNTNDLYKYWILFALFWPLTSDIHTIICLFDRKRIPLQPENKLVVYNLL